MRRKFGYTKVSKHKRKQLGFFSELKTETCHEKKRWEKADELVMSLLRTIKVNESTYIASTCYIKLRGLNCCTIPEKASCLTFLKND